MARLAARQAGTVLHPLSILTFLFPPVRRVANGRRHRQVVFVLLGLPAVLLSSPLGAEAPETVVVQTSTQQVAVTGYTRARRRMPLTVETAGRVLEVNGEVGDPIPDSGIYTCVDGTFTRLELDANQARQHQLQADVAYFRKETRRYRDLMERRTTSQSELDSVQHDLDSHRFQLKALQVEAQRLEEELERCCVKAPPGWRVIGRSVEPGQWVAAGTQVGEVGDFSTLLIPLALDPDELKTLQSSERLQVTLDDLGITVPAAIERISPAFDPKTRKVNVDLLIAQGLTQPRGGLRATLVLQVPDTTGSVLVPERALTESYEQRYLVREKGERVPVVVLGEAGEGLVRVNAPAVSPGDRFLADPSR
jgi:membrane fusion protein (multidrug efflux system)